MLQRGLKGSETVLFTLFEIGRRSRAASKTTSRGHRVALRDGLCTQTRDRGLRPSSASQAQDKLAELDVILSARTLVACSWHLRACLEPRGVSEYVSTSEIMQRPKVTCSHCSAEIASFEVDWLAYIARMMKLAPESSLNRTPRKPSK